MGLFGNMFGSKDSENKKNKEPLPWIPLNSLEQLDAIAKKSESKTMKVMIFLKTKSIFII